MLGSQKQGSQEKRSTLPQCCCDDITADAPTSVQLSMLGIGRHTNQQSWLGRTSPSATQLDNFPAQGNLSLYSYPLTSPPWSCEWCLLGRTGYRWTPIIKAFRKYHFSLFFTLHSIKATPALAVPATHLHSPLCSHPPGTLTALYLAHSCCHFK